MTGAVGGSGIRFSAPSVKALTRTANALLRIARMPETRTATEVGWAHSLVLYHAVDAGEQRLSYVPPASAVSVTLEERWWDGPTGTATSRWGA